MNIIKRNPSTPEGTFGEFFIDNQHICYTLERPNTGEHPCIPTGTYDLEWFDSPHNGWCYLFKNVPGRSMIEMHKANVYTELKGCIAPGIDLGKINGLPAVLGSGYALNVINKKLGNSFTLTIE